MIKSDYFLLGLCVAFAYPFVVYPLVIGWLAQRLRFGGQRTVGQPDYTAALVICAFNEENIIRRKIENSLGLRYQCERLKVVIVSDGSTDGTATIAQQYAEQGLVIIEQPHRRGKIINLNEVVPRLTEDIIVLSDANVIYDANAIVRLLQNFRDPSVGCVSGKVVLRNSTTVIDGATDDYYTLEWALQENSSRFHSMVGADGAMYAFRRELFEPCPPDTIIEDFVIATAILRTGKRVVFEPSAVGWEQGALTLREEFLRKIRIAAGSVQALIRGNGWPSSASGRVWFVFLSHKLFRWLSPLIGIAVLVVASATVGTSAVARIVLAGFGALCILATLRIPARDPHRYVEASFYFMFAQVAMAIGLVRGLMGRQSVLWAKADR